MKTLRFQGYSDDTFGEYGVTNQDVDNCGSCKPIQCLITAGTASLLVVGHYTASHINGGCWVIGFSMESEGDSLPDWPIRLVNGDCEYSPVLEIDVPDRFNLEWFSDCRKVENYYLDWYENRNVPLNGRKNQARTINNERRFLSAFFTWMRKEKLIGSNPVEAIEPLKVAKKPIDYFTPEEMASLKDGCETLRERAVIEVLRSTGARVGEVVGITIDLIDWETGDVMILGEKGNRYRTLYLDPDAIHHFRKYLNSRTDNNPAIFVSSRQPYQALSTCAIRGIVKDVAQRAGITSRAYPHKMRKTLGMELKNKGVDIGTIQEIMGHADSKVTSLYYAQSTPDTLRVVRNKAA